MLQDCCCYFVHVDLTITSFDTNSNCWTVSAFDDEIFEDTTEQIMLELLLDDGFNTGVCVGEPNVAVFNVTDNDGIIARR